MLLGKGYVIGAYGRKISDAETTKYLKICSKDATVYSRRKNYGSTAQSYSNEL